MGNRAKAVIEVSSIIVIILFAAIVTFLFLIQTVFTETTNLPASSKNDFQLKSSDHFTNSVERYTKKVNINKGIGRSNPFTNYK